MKKIYILVLICFTTSCKQEAQTPEKFLNTINNAVVNINSGMKQSMSSRFEEANNEMLQTLDSININIKKAIDNVSSLEEINDSLQLKKEILLFLRKTDTLVRIDYAKFLDQTIAAEKSDSLSDIPKKLSSIKTSSMSVFKKALELMENGIKINEKVLLYHKIYNVPLPDYLKEPNQE